MNSHKVILRLEMFHAQLNTLYYNEVFAYARHAIGKRKRRVESVLYRMRTREIKRAQVTPLECFEF